MKQCVCEQGKVNDNKWQITMSGSDYFHCHAFFVAFAGWGNIIMVTCDPDAILTYLLKKFFDQAV